MVDISFECRAGRTRIQPHGMVVSFTFSHEGEDADFLLPNYYHGQTQNPAFVHSPGCSKRP